MFRPARLVIVLVGIALAAAVVGPRFMSKRSDGAGGAARGGAAAAGGKKAVPVVVHTVTAGPISERLSTTGTLLANEQIEVTSEIPGQLRDVRFQEGASVEEGQVLAELDDAELRARRDQVLHRFELAKRREERGRALLADDLLSPQDYEVLQGELQVQRAELALVEAQLEKTIIRAPFGGRIGLRGVSPGAYVTPQTRIASLQSLNPMKVDFAVPERHADRIRVGQTVEVAVAGVEGRFDAVIYAIEPAIEAATRSLVARARLPNPGLRLRPGQFADVSVVIASTKDALTLPSIAVIPELGGKRVMVVEDGVAAARRIETGIRTDTDVEVTSGLVAGDRVIVSGLERVSPGDPVDMQESE